ncbi:hypothetical protein ACNSOL_12085 (plasmid) [Aliarcobacter lanthieri]|uniref:hypothetical protein n=1 Tax=Aliarcobacter lanthieri TaxID=1355374 RepID=UPI003AACC747
MATSNFYNKNSSKIWSVETSYFDEELNEQTEDEFIWKDTRDNVSSSLEKTSKEKNRNYCEDDSLEIDQLRSFPSTSIGAYWDYFTFCNTEFKVELIPHTTSGYYEGFNLDFQISLNADGIYGDYNNLQDFIADVKEFLLEDNKALRMNLGNLQKRLEILLSEMIDEVESIFGMYSTPLEEFAKFSNGETIYKTVA